MVARQRANAIREIVNGSLLSRRLSMVARQRVNASKEIVNGS